MSSFISLTGFIVYLSVTEKMWSKPWLVSGPRASDLARLSAVCLIPTCGTAQDMETFLEQTSSVAGARANLACQAPRHLSSPKPDLSLGCKFRARLNEDTDRKRECLQPKAAAAEAAQAEAADSNIHSPQQTNHKPLHHLHRFCQQQSSSAPFCWCKSHWWWTDERPVVWSDVGSFRSFIW